MDHWRPTGIVRLRIVLGQDQTDEPRHTKKVMFGAQRLRMMARAPIQKERATPRIARTFPLRVACRFGDTRLRP
jgi:hypothetical protein